MAKRKLVTKTKRQPTASEIAADKFGYAVGVCSETLKGFHEPKVRAAIVRVACLLSNTDTRTSRKAVPKKKSGSKS